MLGRLLEHDILGLYANWETIPASAERIGQRFRRNNPFLGIGQDLTTERDRLERAFLAFYPDLCSYSLHQQAGFDADGNWQSKASPTDNAQ
jgi:acyl carrier protein phosphodiesterase